MRLILRHHDITSGHLVIDDTDHPRSTSAQARAHLYNLREKESGGYRWGQSLVLLVWVTPTISIPVGLVFYQPTPCAECVVEEGKGPQEARCPPKTAAAQASVQSPVSPDSTTRPALA